MYIYITYIQLYIYMYIPILEIEADTQFPGTSPLKITFRTYAMIYYLILIKHIDFIDDLYYWYTQNLYYQQ